MGMFSSFHVLSVHAHYSLLTLSGCKVTNNIWNSQNYWGVFIKRVRFYLDSCKTLGAFSLSGIKIPIAGRGNGDMYYLMIVVLPSITVKSSMRMSAPGFLAFMMTKQYVPSAETSMFCSTIVHAVLVRSLTYSPYT